MTTEGEGASLIYIAYVLALQHQCPNIRMLDVFKTWLIVYSSYLKLHAVGYAFYSSCIAK